MPASLPRGLRSVCVWEGLHTESLVLALMQDTHFASTLNMNILRHCISQVLHRKQMAHSNWDYLRRFNLQRYYFQRCRQSVRKANRMWRNPKLEAGWLSPSPGKRGWGEGTVWNPRKKGGCLMQRAETCLEGHSGKAPGPTYMPWSHPMSCLQPPAKTPHKQNSKEGPGAEESGLKFSFTSLWGKEQVYEKDRIMPPLEMSWPRQPVNTCEWDLCGEWMVSEGWIQVAHQLTWR